MCFNTTIWGSNGTSFSVCFFLGWICFNFSFLQCRLYWVCSSWWEKFRKKRSFLQLMQDTTTNDFTIWDKNPNSQIKANDKRAAWSFLFHVCISKTQSEGTWQRKAVFSSFTNSNNLGMTSLSLTHTEKWMIQGYERLSFVKRYHKMNMTQWPELHVSQQEALPIHKLQAMCDGKVLLICIIVGYPGSVLHTTHLQNSRIYKEAFSKVTARQSQYPGTIINTVNLSFPLYLYSYCKASMYPFLLGSGSVKNNLGIRLLHYSVKLLSLYDLHWCSDP